MNLMGTLPENYDLIIFQLISRRKYYEKYITDQKGWQWVIGNAGYR